MSANLDMNSNRVTNVTDGANNQDAVTVAQLNAASVVANTTTAALTTLADAGGSYGATTVEGAFTELASNTNGEGASIIGVEDAAGNFAGADVEACLAEIISDLAATTSGNGASLVGVEDSAGNLTATDVEAALAEIFTSLADPTKVLIHGGTPQTLTGAGAVNLTTATTWIVTTGADALTLADGTEGQRKFIVMKTDGGAGTLTPSNLGNGTTITFDDVGDSADLLFTNSAWHFMGGTATLA
jgi:hypothetical protein